MCELSIQNLNFKYGKKEVLRDINLCLHKGVTGILGPNGAGKTTLMKILTTVLPFSEGMITLNNQDYKNSSLKTREKLGYLPQDFNVYPQLTGRELLEFICTIKTTASKKEIKFQVNQLIEKLNLQEFQNKKIKTYSGGTRQRLGIAQALIGDPDLLIIDEPTVGLDPEQRNNFRELLSSVGHNRITILSTHIVEDVELCCNNLIVIDNGVINYCGTVENFILKAKNNVWRIVTDGANLENYYREFRVINSIRREDKIELRIIGDLNSISGAIAEAPTLQDAYLYHQSQNCNKK